MRLAKSYGFLRSRAREGRSRSGSTRLPDVTMIPSAGQRWSTTWAKAIPSSVTLRPVISMRTIAELSRTITASAAVRTSIVWKPASASMSAVTIRMSSSVSAMRMAIGLWSVFTGRLSIKNLGLLGRVALEAFPQGDAPTRWISGLHLCYFGEHKLPKSYANTTVNCTRVHPPTLTQLLVREVAAVRVRSTGQPGC